MPSKAEELQSQLDRLIVDGELLRLAMLRDLGKISQELRNKLREKDIKLPRFKSEYDVWYSIALRVVAQTIPDRLQDFIEQYKSEKRKKIDYLTYTLSDYLLGLKTEGPFGVIVDTSAGIPKMERQLAILKSAKAVFRTSLADLAEVIQANLFDSELEAATELGKCGFFRGAGAIAGVVLERHLSHVCDEHKLKSPKKRTSIGDLNQLLKDNGVIDTPKWRFVQHLADLRNLCDHKSEREPVGEDIQELVEGVGKVIKTTT